MNEQLPSNILKKSSLRKKKKVEECVTAILEKQTEISKIRCVSLSKQ